MDKKNGKKTNKEKRVLISALCVAAVMIAGSTFAWFTSKDEVTNRLSASAEYNVAVAETFQPPENWVPGQEINKDAAAVNTGNVDAFARMWLTGSMRLMKQTTSKTGANLTAFKSLTTVEDVTDSNIKSMGLTKYDTANEVYYKTLDKTQTLNPGASGGTDKYGFGTKMSGPYSEVQAMQGSRLAYSPAGGSYAFVTKQETTLPVWLNKGGSTTAAYETVTVQPGTLVIVNAPESSRDPSTLAADGTFTAAAATTITPSSGAAYSSTITVYVDTLPILTNVEYESFTPLTDGLYLFLRNELDNDVAFTDLEYSGYYVTGITSNNASTGTYYALNTNTDGTNRSDNTIKSVADNGTTTVASPIKTTIKDGVITAVVPDEGKLELYNAAYDDLDNSKLKFYAAAADTSAHTQKLYAVYDDANDTAFNKDKDIIVEIDLANVGTDPQQWTGIGGTALTANYKDGTTDLATLDASKLTFYYNDDIEAGDSSAILVDKVKLYDGVTQKAYLAFDFDLNVNLESIQVTMDENGKELATAVNGDTGWAATGTVNTPAKGTADNASGDAKEIGTMTWSALS